MAAPGRDVAGPRHILLVGGSGFLGGHAARGLIAAGHRVAVLARGEREPAPGATLIRADRRDHAAMGAALRGHRFDLTVDFGVFDAPDLDWLARVDAAHLGRFAMISTGQVYLVGAGATAPYAEEEDRHALMPEPAAGSADHGAWAYGAGKRRAEAALKRAGEHGLPVVALRLPTVQGEADASLRLWAWLERMLDGGPLVLPDGARRPIRFFDARDLAAALTRIATAPALAHDAYNLSEGDSISLREFLARAARAAGVTPRFVDASWEECRAQGFDALPYAGHWASVLDPSRATAELGFTATGSADYLPRIVRWHLEHRPAQSHESYAARAREQAWAARRVASGTGGGH